MFGYTTFQNSVLHHYFAGTCNELPIGMNLMTDAVFPIAKGTEVYVNCATGYTLTAGYWRITCDMDAEYTYSQGQPTCSIGRFQVLSYHSLID